METNFALRLNSLTPIIINPKGDVLSTLLAQIENVVIDSLLKTFGLDELLRSQYGDYLKKIGTTLIEYQQDPAAVEAMLESKAQAYIQSTRDGFVDNAKTMASEQLFKLGSLLNNKIGHKLDFATKYLPKSPQELAHANSLEDVVDSEAIKNDIESAADGALAGLATVALQKTNVCEWANKAIDIAQGAQKVCDQIEQISNLPSVAKEALIAEGDRIVQQYSSQLCPNYQPSSELIKLTGKNINTIDLKLEAKQVIGLILNEVWFSVRAEFVAGFDNLQNFLRRLINAIKTGFKQAMAQYGNILRQGFSAAIDDLISTVQDRLISLFSRTLKRIKDVLQKAAPSLLAVQSSQSSTCAALCLRTILSVSL